MRPAFPGVPPRALPTRDAEDTVEAALRLAREEGATTILDPAPARPLSPECLAEVDILTPNESEACRCSAAPFRRIGFEQAPELARAILATGPRAVILKLGEIGCYYDRWKDLPFRPRFNVEAVDTTAAGDTFNGALAVALAEARPIDDALRFANAAAAPLRHPPGAQASVPTRDEVDRCVGLNDRFLRPDRSGHMCAAGKPDLHALLQGYRCGRAGFDP